MNATHQAALSRRDFLRRCGACAAAVSVGWLGIEPLSRAALASSTGSEPGWGLLIDLTRCQGCNSCALACKKSNELPNPDDVPSALSFDAYTFVETRHVTLASGAEVDRYVKRQCMHCLHASCVSACPAAAMHSSGEGPVIYRPERCLGCRYCQVACPFEIPRFDWNDGISPTISKCWLCFDRLEAGQLPACVEACPAGALRFGRRSDLLAQAHAQIISNPGRYVDQVYGEFEVGGTSVLYLSDVAFADLGFVTDLPDTAPAESTETIMGTLPAVIGGVAALMTGTALYTHRQPSAQHASGTRDAAAEDQEA